MYKIKGKLKLISLETRSIVFYSENKPVRFKAESKQQIRELFSNTSFEQAKEGINASFDGETSITTDRWETARRVGLLSGISQLSHHFC